MNNQYKNKQYKKIENSDLFHRLRFRLLGFFAAACVLIAVFYFLVPKEKHNGEITFFACGVIIIIIALAAFILWQLGVHSQSDRAGRTEETMVAKLQEITEPSENGLDFETPLEEEIALRRKAQEIAGQIYNELEQIFNAASPLCVIDKDHNVVRCNHSYTKLFEIDDDENHNKAPRKCHDVWKTELCQTADCPIKRLGEGMDSGEYEVKTTIGEGKKKTLHISTYPYKDSAGRFNGIVASITDITEQAEARKRESLHQEQLLQADKMASLGVLVSGVAHEINNPNTFITLNAPILKRVWNALMPVLVEYHQQGGDLDIGGMTFPEIREMIPEILTGMEDGAKRINKIVGSLKDFARKEPDRLDEDVDISQVVASALTLLNNIIRKSTNTFSVSYGPDIPLFRGNSQQIEQVVMNLIINACQALPDMSKGISVSTAYEPEKGILMTVRDEGEGIPLDIMKSIFNPFFTTKRDTGGTGLGLSISSNIIEAHKGKMEIDTTLGKGTVFTVVIPASIA